MLYVYLVVGTGVLGIIAFVCDRKLHQHAIQLLLYNRTWPARKFWPQCCFFSFTRPLFNQFFFISSYHLACECPRVTRYTARFIQFWNLFGECFRRVSGYSWVVYCATSCKTFSSRTHVRHVVEHKSYTYSAFANSCPLQTDTFLFPLIYSHNVIFSSNKFQ